MIIIDLRKFLGVGLFIIFLLLYVHCTEINSTHVPKAVKGEIDLTTYCFEKQKTIQLNGDWQLYASRLLSPEDFRTDTTLVPDFYIQIPTSWTKYRKKSKTFSAYGYVTYRLIINQLNENKTFALKLSNITSAYKIWFNGNLLHQTGNVSVTESDENGKYDFVVLPITFFKQLDSCKIVTNEIVIQVSNFEFTRAGIRNTVSYGLYKDVLKTYNQTISLTYMILGIVLIISLFHFFLFLIYKKEKSNLVFFIVCISIGLRLLCVNERTVTLIFDQINSNLVLRLVIFSTILFILSTYVFVFYLFPKNFSKISVKSAQILGLLSLATIFWVPLYISDLIGFIWSLVGIGLGLYVFTFILFSAIKNKTHDAIFLFSGFLVIFLTALHDFFWDTNFILHWGLLGFVLIQSVLLTRRYKKTLKESQELSEVLRFQNEHLNDLIEFRTLELKEKQEEILAQNEEILEQHEELLKLNESQNDTIKKLEETTFALHSSLNYARSIQISVLPTEKKLLQFFDEIFIISLPKDIVSGDFYWFEQINNREAVFVLADCTGHGVPGAFISMISSTLLHEIISKNHIYESHIIASELNDGINKILRQHETKNDDGLDICIIVFHHEPEYGILQIDFAGAKSNIYFMVENQIVRLTNDRFDIGMVHEKIIEFTKQSYIIPDNTTIYFSTDGYIDQNNSERKKIGKLKFMETLSQIHNMELVEQKKFLMNILDEHKQNELQRDDITVIGVRCNNSWT